MPFVCLVHADGANIWEEDLESESNIRYDSRSGQVIGATLNKLVERVSSTRDHGGWREGEGRVVCGLVIG